MPDLPQGEQRWTVRLNARGGVYALGDWVHGEPAEIEVVPSSVAAERARLRGALEFYANRRHYAWETAYGGAENAEEGEGVGCRWTSACAVAEDHGSRARVVLADLEEDKP